MKLTTPLIPLLALLLTSSSATECGQWYSSACVCDTDMRYCPDGANGASDDLIDQHPFWKDYEGFYSYTIHTFMFGLYSTADPTDYFKTFPAQGFMNQTIAGSRMYNHRYILMAPNPAADCTNPIPVFYPDWTGECGVNGHSNMQEGFGTTAPERDGTVVTTLALQPTAAGGMEGTSITDESAKYKQVPIDSNTLFGSAKSMRYLVTETFSFTNQEKTEASAVQDVYMTAGNVTTLVQSNRFSFTKFVNAQAFEDAVLATYDDFRIHESARMNFPMAKSCNQAGECPTEADFCEIDPRCSNTIIYAEPSASVAAGPIVGIVLAVFVVLLGVLYYFHRDAMAKQAARNQATFARRIAETIKLEGPDRTLTPEALAEEFKKIDGAGNTDGTIDKKELWEFLNSGKVAKMNESDFNALFSALDTDGDGTVSFMEFSAYMGKAYGDFEKAKDSSSVRDVRGGMKKDNFYSGVSSRILSIVKPEEKVDKMEEISEENV